MSRIRKDYEWCVEFTDKHGEIQDSDHSDKLDPAFLSQLASDHVPKCQSVLVLVLNEWTENDGLVDRYWAYPTPEGMPLIFEDAFQNQMPHYKVPKKLLKEYTRKIGTSPTRVELQK